MSPASASTLTDSASVRHIGEHIAHALRASEERSQQLAAIVDQSECAIITKDLDNVVLTWNRGAERLYGASASAAIGRPVWNSIDPNRTEEKKAEAIDRVRAGRSVTLEQERETVDGRIIMVESRLSPLFDKCGKHIGEILIAQDIGGRKHTEAELRASEERVRVIFEHAAVGIARTTSDGLFVQVNQRMCDLLAYSEDEMLNIRLSQITHPDDQTQYIETHRRLWAGEIASYTIEKRYIKKDASHIWVNATISGIGDANGRVESAIVIIEDISERKKAEDALRTSEARAQQLAAIVDQSDNAIITKDLNNVVLTWNRGAERLFGCTATEAIGRVVWASTDPDASAEHRTATIEKLRARRSVIVERERKLKDGRTITAEMSFSPLFDDAGSHIGEIALIRDVSERKRADQALRQSNEELKQINQKLNEAQNQLLQSEKMASIGQLAAGVAHEINNPIGYVNSNLNSLMAYLEQVFKVIGAYEQSEQCIVDAGALQRIAAAKQSADLQFLKQDVIDLMKESREGITRVKKIVQDLKDFSHVGADDEWKWADLHDGLDSTLNIVNNEVKYKAQVVKEYGALPQIECLPSQLNQVFLNLLVNAAHAIERQGTITIRSGAQADGVWVEIADTGSGIPPENLARIFDPFFTTKPVGKGTGLGLSLSFGIVQKHRGRIEVRSEVGVGTTFRVTLPLERKAGSRL